MLRWLRLHTRQFGLGLLALTVVSLGIIGLLSMRAEERMPPDQRIYWDWVGSISRSPDAALATGLELLKEHPHLSPLYLRLARICLETNTVEPCRDALINIQPPTPLSRLYKEAALLRLDQNEAITPWQQLARAPELDPTLARLIVSETWPDAVSTIEAIWQHQLGIDSTAVGAAFGLGYAAVLRSDWEVGEAMLTRSAELASNDPLIYREFGRIYFFTGKPDLLEQALARGLEAAKVQHDLQQELILRGNLGWTLYQRSGDMKQAEGLITEALKQSRELADETTEGYNLWRLANIYVQQNRFDEAVPLVRAADVLYAEHVPTQHAEVVALHGLLLSRMMRFSEAERVLEQAIEEAEANRTVIVKVNALVSLARVRLQMGRYKAVSEIGEEALSLARQYQLTDQEIVTRMALGDSERLYGNYDEANEHYSRSVELARQAKSSHRARESFFKLGLTALNLRDPITAKVYFENMLETVEQTGNQFRMAEAYMGLARTYSRVNDTQQALRYYDLALALDQVKGLTQAEILIAKAWTLLDMAAYEEAEVLFNEAVRAAPALFWVQYRVALGLGDIAFSQGECQAALQHFRRAETANEQMAVPDFNWYALFGKAMTQWCLGNLAEAEVAFTRAIRLIESVRGDLASADNRATYVQNKARVYEYFASFLENQGRDQEAFHFMERARSRSLVDLLYTAQREQKPDMSQSTDKAIELDRRLRAIAQEISAEPLNDDSTGYLAVRSAQLRREYERTDSMYQQVQANLVAERPMFTFNPLPEDAARATLEDGEAMILYDLRRLGTRGREEEASVAYIVLPDQVIKKELSIQSDALTQTIRTFRERLGTAEAGPGEDWELLSGQLYQDLVAPVVEALPSSVTHLHIVPEGALYYLPFATLQDASGRFLIEDYTLSVTPSASILKLSRDRNTRRWESMLLLADPDGSLPGARREVAAIAGGAQRRYALVGENATQENLTENAGQFDILHFATHGRFVPNAPWRSHLELYDGKELDVEAIGRMKLNAYLVTLSACETGLSGGLVSEIPNGEEWVGLNQAFLAAGTPTVMASLWPINDRISSDFMTSFYRALGPGGKAKALAEVQRQFIRNAATQHPFYWAPFTIMGDPL